MKEKEEAGPARRSQRDYPLGFKLAVVRQVEEGELTYSRRSAITVFREGARCWRGSENTVGWTGVIPVYIHA